MNAVGSPYGSFSPLNHTGYPMDLTMRDCVHLHKRCLDQLEITSVQCVIGGSMGGMTVLEWPLCYPELVKAVVPIATAARQTAWCIGWSESQRQAICADPLYQDGNYDPETVQLDL
jgi:homoserine O-acetyltransferase/O-succinyltransferase